MSTTTIRLHLFSLLLALQLVAASAQAADETIFVKITDLHYPDWITADPLPLLPEFEQSCTAVATYLHGQKLEFDRDECVNNLYTTTTFIARANDFVDNNLSANPKAAEAKTEAARQYGRVVTDVIGKAMSDGKAVTQKDNVNLIYTVIVTIAKDVLTDYYQKVLADPNEGNVLMHIAKEENGKRLRREGAYQEIYKQLEKQ